MAFEVTFAIAISILSVILAKIQRVFIRWFVKCQVFFRGNKKNRAG